MDNPIERGKCVSIGKHFGSKELPVNHTANDTLGMHFGHKTRFNILVVVHQHFSATVTIIPLIAHGYEHLANHSLPATNSSGYSNKFLVIHVI